MPVPDIRTRTVDGTCPTCGKHGKQLETEDRDRGTVRRLRSRAGCKWIVRQIRLATEPARVPARRDHEHAAH